MLVFMRSKGQSVIIDKVHRIVIEEVAYKKATLKGSEGSAIVMEGTFVEARKLCHHLKKVTILLLDTGNNRVKIGIDAPSHIIVDREEVHLRRQQERN